MATLVTIVQLNNALRLGLDIDDLVDTARVDDATLKLEQAEDIVLDFIHTTAAAEEWDDTNVPGRVSAAIILTVKCLLDDTPEAAAMLSGLSGTIPVDARNPIAALLWRLRKPSLA